MIWAGILALIALLIQTGLGVAMTVFNKPVLKYHKIFGFILLIVAIIHVVLAIMLWFFGKII
jgi:hypothetical protein